MKHRNLKFIIKPATAVAVKKILKKMAKKKSKGKDGISQDCLILGGEVLAEPLSKIINVTSFFSTLYHVTFTVCNYFFFPLAYSRGLGPLR